MLTARQKAILDWQVTEGAQDWYDNAVAELGQAAADVALASKVSKYAAKYDAATDKRPKSIREAP